MATSERYQAKADPRVARDLAGTTSPFIIEVRFLGGLTPRQVNAFRTAADRWSRVIVGDLPSVVINGEVIDDVLILAQGADIDGSGQVLGHAVPTHLRPANSGRTAFLPAKGIMTFDAKDLAEMELQGTLNDVITHEMGHVLGIGTIWARKELLRGAKTANPTFTGQHAMNEYGKLRDGAPTPVPVANAGGAGTRDCHWRERIFGNELMSGSIAAARNPISRVTVASLRDLGYHVDMNAAEPYALPTALAVSRSRLRSTTRSLGVGSLTSSDEPAGGCQQLAEAT